MLAAAVVMAVVGIGLGAPGAHADVAKTEVQGAIDLNTASVADLAALPGIGESKAKAIVAWREATPFRSVDELRDVKGIGDKMLEKLRPHLSVSQVAGAVRAKAETASQSASGGASPARSASQAAQAGKVAEAVGR